MAKDDRWTGTRRSEVGVIPRAKLLCIRPLESRVLGNLQARFGGRRMEKVSTPVDRHCDRKRTDKRNLAETENLASRPSHRVKLLAPDGRPCRAGFPIPVITMMFRSS